jgi:hypothetical protein
VDGDILAVLLNRDRGPLRMMAKLQPTLRRLTRPGECIKFAATKGYDTTR